MWVIEPVNWTMASKAVSLDLTWTFGAGFIFINTKENSMAALKGTRTEQCMKDAFAGESQANRRYL